MLLREDSLEAQVYEQPLTEQWIENAFKAKVFKIFNIGSGKVPYGHLWKPPMCRDYRFAVMQARLSRQRLGFQPCLGESNAASAQQAASLSDRNNFGSELR